MKPVLRILIGILCANIFTQDPRCAPRMDNNAKDANKENITKLTGLSNSPDERSLASKSAKIKFYLSFSMIQNGGIIDDENPVDVIGVMNSPFESEEISIDDGKAIKNIKLPRVNIEHKLPITTKKSRYEDKGCLYINGTEKTCKGFYFSGNTIISILARINNINFAEEVGLDLEKIKIEALKATNMQFDIIEASKESPTVILCTHGVENLLKCTISLPYLVNFK